MTERQPLQVGQKLWYVPNRSRAPGSAREVTVTKVGRKWAELDIRRRIDMATLEADGGGYMSPGQCYLSRDEYEAKMYRDRLWSALRQHFYSTYGIPTALTADDIRRAAEILGVDLSEVEQPRE